jgi:hypothetical protein
VEIVQAASAAFPGAMAIAAMALAFLLSFAIALLYAALRTGQQRSREFAQTLALSGIVSSLIVLAIDGSIARGFGLVGALAVMRFRGDVKDPRDAVFAMAASAAGVAAGAYAWTLGLGGTVIFIIAASLISRPWFARVDCLQAVLKLTVGPEAADQETVAFTLRHYCSTFALVRVWQVSPFVQEHSYHVQLKRARDRPALVEAMKQLVRAEDATLDVMSTVGTLADVSMGIR